MTHSSLFDPGHSYRSSGVAERDRAPIASLGQAGFSLIEALVTLAILSIGLMGLAFLQAQGMQFSTSAYSRSQASILTSDILDRMRLNPGSVADYDTSSYTPAPGDCDPTLAPEPTNDRDCWFRRLRESLPSGDGAISVDAAGLVTVTVSWRERPGGAPDDDFDPSTLSDADLIQSMSMSATI